MADDSLEVEKDVLPFHPCTTPRGMPWYDLTVLTPLQQAHLNELKVVTIREDNQYLARHPEIRALVSLFTQSVLREKKLGTPMHVLAMKFFTRPERVLKREIEQYLKGRGEPLKKTGDSAVNVRPPGPAPTPTDEESTSSCHGLYTYLSYTDLAGTPESEPEVEAYDMEDFRLPAFEASLDYLQVPTYLHHIAEDSATEAEDANVQGADDHVLDLFFSPHDIPLVENAPKSSVNIAESTINLAESTISLAELLIAPNNSESEHSENPAPSLRSVSGESTTIFDYISLAE